MSCHAGPDIVENGLVFCYDMNNTQKSWRGKPTTNLHSNPDLSLGLTSNYGQYGPTPPIISTANDVPTTLGQTRNVLQCQCDPGGWGAALWFAAGPQTVGTTYTISYYIRCLTSAPIWLGFSCQNGSGDQNSLTHSIAVTNKWQRFSHTATVDIAKGSWFVYGGTNGSVFQIADFQFEESSFATPFVNGTRSITQAILDLTNKSTITAPGLTYNSDGSFDFNYANSSTIQIPLSTAFNKLEGTINVWIYPTRYNGANGIFSNRPDTNYNEGNWLWIGPYSGTFYFRLGDGSSCCSNDLSIANYQSYVPLNSWTNLCCTWKSANTSAIYINGQLNTSRSISTIPNTNPHSIGAFGVGHANADGYFHGKMSIGQIYNRQLSPSEVSQNFNAIRKRYGV